MRWPLVTVTSRADRLKLHVEWCAWPLGFGGSMVWPLDVWRLYSDGFDPIVVSWLIWPALAMLIGWWRPTHRRYGLRRYDRWRAPR